MEEPLHQIDQSGIRLVEHGRDASGVFLETGHIGTRHIEEFGSIGLFLARDVKDLSKGGDFVAGHKPVRLGHLGAEANDGDGKTDRALRGRPQTVKDLRQTLAGAERAEGIGDTGPDRHGARA